MSSNVPGSEVRAPEVRVYEFTKEESSAIKRLALDEALSIATVTFQRAGDGSQPYAYQVSDMDAFQALVASTVEREESMGRLINQAMRDGTLIQDPA